MPRRKQDRDKHRIPIDLDMTEPYEKAIWEHWLSLAEFGVASAWARNALYDAIPTPPEPISTFKPPAAPLYKPQSTSVRRIEEEALATTPKPPDHMDGDENTPGYETRPIETLTPNEIIRQRKAIARQKFDKR